MSRHRESGYGVREVVLQVRTGTHLLAGTEAKVWMRVGNENDRTQWFHVASESGAFRRGEVDEVVLRLGPSVDPGVIDRVEVFHDGGGAFDGWYLDEIHVEGRRLDFDTWLARDEPPYRLDATSLYDEQLRAYTVAIHTSEALFAGTDANVFVQIMGSRTSTPWIRLHRTSVSLFESGQTDEVTIFAEDVGAVVGVWIRHDGSGMLDGWRVDWIEVDGRRMAIDRWLGRRSGDGRCDALHRLRPWVDAKRPMTFALCTFEGLQDQAEAAFVDDLTTLGHLLGRHGLDISRAPARFDVVLPRSWASWQAQYADPRALLVAAAAARKLVQPARAGGLVPVTYGGKLELPLRNHSGLSHEQVGVFMALPSQHPATIGHEIGRFFGLPPSQGCEEPDGPSSRLRHLRNPDDVLDGAADNLMSDSTLPVSAQSFTSGQVDAMAVRMLRYVG